jgi:hypothetical protein
MSVRLALPKDFPSIQAIYAEARSFMRKSGNPAQWGANHPDWSLIAEDYAQGELYVLYDAKGLYGVFALKKGEDPTYAHIAGQWLSSAPYLTIHSLASGGTHKAVFKEALAFSLTQSRHLRIDTHEKNALMRKLILANGFVSTGQCREPDGSERVCYERL